jgi:P4 family phage/plasmid primase-like protien
LKNYFVSTTRAYATDGHIDADKLRDVIKAHEGGEAYHCAYDLEPRETFSNYVGIMRPALGYVWFDFDSHDGGVEALKDTRAFIDWLGVHDVFICYSGSKGFHVGVPFSCFGIEPSADLSTKLNRLASTLKLTYPSMDTTIYNANRKFRALGSKHPKTGLYKIRISDIHATLDEIKTAATARGPLDIPFPALRSPLDKLTTLLAPVPVAEKKPPAAKKDWTAPSGAAAFEKCGFLTHCRDNPKAVNEPQWYAALSIVSRFQDGRKQCHSISHAHPKYSVTECNDKIDQAEKESAPRTCENVSTLYDGCARCPLFGKINSPVNIFDTRFYIVGDKGKLIPDYNSLLKYFQDASPYKTIADMKTVYRFNVTHYEEFTPIEIKAFAEDSFEPKPQDKCRQEFVHKVFANSVTRRTFFSRGTENHINFKNGILDIEGKSLIEHSPDFGFRHVLPYEYRADAVCPTFDAWIRDVMLDDEDLVKILQEFMGYVVRGGEYKYHKALWLSGSGRNGKSTFLSVLKALIGAGNYSTLSIRQIISDKFSSADLDGKIANFSEETSPEELSDSGPFKNLTGDGELLAQKKYGDPYSFRNRAKLIMTYNEVPLLKDLSPGMLSRPIIIPWKKDLSDEGLQDKNLGKKLLSELPGVFNFALAGWERLEAQEQFTKSEKSLFEMEEIRSSSCSAAQWLSETIQFDKLETTECLKPRQMYEAYKQTVGQYAYAESKFYKRINSIPEVAKRKKRGEKGVEYFGMKFRRGNVGNVEF